MLMGKNNSQNNSFNSNPTNFTSNFDERFNTVLKEAIKNGNKISPYAKDDKAMNYANVNSKHEMADKSFAMLQERLNNGLISLEEFNKKCQQLNRRRQK